MANYCSASDVQVALGYQSAFDASSRPTLTQVTQIITDTTNEIDLYLNSVGITTQPTSTVILGRLSQACKFGASAQVGFGYLNNAGSVPGTLADTYWTRYNEILQEIKNSPELYGGAGSTNTDMFMSNQVEDGTYTEDEIDDLYLSPGFNI